MSNPLFVRDVVVGAVGMATGVLVGMVSNGVVRKWITQLKGLRQIAPRYDGMDSDGDEDEDELVASGEAYKLVFCVRTDLKMQKGKIAAQVGHATLGVYKSARRRQPDHVRIWEAQAQPKIALQVSSREQATRLQNKAKSLGLTTYQVYDAGRTQIAAVSYLQIIFTMLKSAKFDIERKIMLVYAYKIFILTSRLLLVYFFNTILCISMFCRGA